MTVYPVWALLEDGPCAGDVVEVPLASKELRILTDDGPHIYRRYAWGLTARSHRIAKYTYVKSFSDLGGI